MSPYKSLIFFLLILAGLLSNVYSDFVPVYIWEKSNAEELEPTLSRVSKDTFKEVINSRIDKKTLIVVFAEQNLSPEDFVLNAEPGKQVFPNLSQLKTTTKVTYLPFVEDPISVIKGLTDKEVIEVSVNNLMKTNSLPKGEILIIDLNDAKDNENRIEMLNRHDSSIISLYDSLLKANERVIALYTGHSASWVTTEEIRKHRLARHILAANEKKAEFFKTEDMIMYLTEIIWNNSTLNVQALTTSKGSDNSINATITTDEVWTIKMFFEDLAGYWNLSEVLVENATHNHNMKVKSISFPKEFSYHCSSQSFKEYPLINAELAQLHIKSWQIQVVPGNISERFSDAYDCVGFTTVPIWSGLFVTFILVTIMTMGLAMIMDIKTMDRFDDPKGKTIIINASE